MQRIPRKLSIAALGVALMLGSAATSAKAQSLSFIRDAEIEATLKRMSTPVFRAASMAPDSIRIFIVNDKSLNAFVVARNMVFHTGLLTKLESPEELYGVIAHETAHIAAGHAVQRAGAVRQAAGPVILSVILGIAAAAAGQGGRGGRDYRGGPDRRPAGISEIHPRSGKLGGSGRDWLSGKPAGRSQGDAHDA